MIEIEHAKILLEIIDSVLTERGLTNKQTSDNLDNTNDQLLINATFDSLEISDEDLRDVQPLCIAGLKQINSPMLAKQVLYGEMSTINTETLLNAKKYYQRIIKK